MLELLSGQKIFKEKTVYKDIKEQLTFVKKYIILFLQRRLKMNKVKDHVFLGVNIPVKLRDDMVKIIKEHNKKSPLAKMTQSSFITHALNSYLIEQRSLAPK